MKLRSEIVPSESTERNRHDSIESTKLYDARPQHQESYELFRNILRAV
jgi:hypothetical protein